MMATTITCYGGINEIGGSKILVEDGDVRVFLDFGKPFGRYSDYFDGVFVRERTTRGLLDAMALGLIPPLEGLYRDDLVPVFNPAHVTVREEEYTDRGGRRRTRKCIECDGEAACAEFWARFRSYPGYRDLRRDALSVDAMVVSHAHLDHSGDLDFVLPDIPVFSTRMTAFIAKAMQDSGKPGASGVVYANPYTVKENGLLGGDQSRGYVWRQWGFLDGEPIGEANASDPFASAWSFWVWRSFKQDQPAPEAETHSEPAPLNLRWWPLDHSLFGAAGFVVETTAGLIAYTGDLRFHGQNRDLTYRFAEELSALHPLALLCEGTRAGISEQVTEAEVRDNCLAAIRAAKGHLVVADFAPRNVERLITFLDIARQTDRCLLVQPKDAYLLAAMRLAEPASVPALEQEPWLAMYDDPKSQQYKWEQMTRQAYADSLVGPDEVKAHPGDYILALSLWDMADLLDIEHILGAVPGGTYVYSNSKAYDDEQKVDLVRLWNWIGHFGMTPVGLQAMSRDRTGRVTEVDVVPGYHASGHANGPELLQFVKTVRPHKLVAVHTEEPQWWAEQLAETGIRVELPIYAQPIHL
jgi:ribonuclease J